jgi:predicted double-glycine peptidase
MVSVFVPETINLSFEVSDVVPMESTFAPVSTLSETSEAITSALEEDEDVPTETDESQEIEKPQRTESSKGVRKVPFFSQFTDITSPAWQKVGCGIASLAMLIEYYEPESVSVDGLLEEGIAANAFLSDAGWTHAGLINLSKKYGLTGESRDLRTSSMDTAFAALKDELSDGPVMVSVHYTFDPLNPIPHLVVVNAVKDGSVYYNDPAEKAGGGAITIAKFQSAWKKRYIDIHPIS